MAPRKRRSTRPLEDLPGLFDEFDISFKAPDPYREILEEHRKRQTSKADIDSLQAETLNKHKDLQFISFGSGSSGNCAYIGIAGEGGVLIDAGIETDKVIEALRQNCITLDKIKGIILTHDHSDHVRYAYSLLRKIPNMVIFCTPRTLSGILRRHSISRRIKDYHKPIFREFAFEAGPFMVTPFEVSHDGSDNVGFCVTACERNFVIATDMGKITDRANYYIRRANYLMIESNYDAAMLATGTYPEYLKARIRSDVGHLNNQVTANYLAKIWHPALTDIYLCHLSQDNNRPEIALKVNIDALTAKGITVGDDSGSAEARAAQVRLSALPRFESSALFIHRLL